MPGGHPALPDLSLCILKKRGLGWPCVQEIRITPFRGRDESHQQDAESVVATVQMMRTALVCCLAAFLMLWPSQALAQYYPLPVEASVGVGVLTRGQASLVGALSWDYEENAWAVLVVEGEFNGPTESDSCQATDAPDSCVDAVVLGGVRFRGVPHVSSGARPFASILLGKYWKGSGGMDRDFASDHFTAQMGSGVEIRWPGSIQGVRLSLDYRRVFGSNDQNQLRFLGAYVIGPRRFMRGS